MAASIVFFLAGGPAHAQKQPVDLILVNGDVRTMDSMNPRAEAVAVAGAKIIAVGRNAEIRSLAGERTRVIDAKGRLVLPGFNDAHVHFAAIGNKFSSIDLKDARSPEEVAAKLAEYARYLPKGRWILGGGFNPEAGDGGLLRRLADAVTPHNPIFVYSADGKAAFVNAAALSRVGNAAKLAGNSGLITGPPVSLIASAVPTDHTRNWPEIIETATNYAASLGVTSVQDMHSDELAEVYRELDREGKLKTRVYDCSPMSAVARFIAAGVKAPAGNAMVRTGCVKLLSEGEDSELPRLRADIAAADRAGLQVMVHAIGPQANRLVLDAFEWVGRTNGRRDRRFRVEHAHDVDEQDMPRFARAGIVSSMQPFLFFSLEATAPYDGLEKAGTRLAFGSDASIAEFDPLLGIAAAMTGPGALSFEKAIWAYTHGAAYGEFQEGAKGSLEKGKLADFVVFGGGVSIYRPEDVRKLRVTATFVDGKQVFGPKL